MNRYEAWEIFKAKTPELPYDWDFLERIADQIEEHTNPREWIGGILQHRVTPISRN